MSPQSQYFKIEGIHVVRDLLLQGDRMSRIDLKDAYFAIPIHKDFQHYLRFMWQSQAYQFTCFLFGLSTAPGYALWLVNSAPEQGIVAKLEPSQIIDFLGFVVDSLKRELRLPQTKLTHIRQEARR